MLVITRGYTTFYAKFYGKIKKYPPVVQHSALEDGPVEIVVPSLFQRVIFHRYVTVITKGILVFLHAKCYGSVDQS